MMRWSHPVLTPLCAALVLGLSACGSSPAVRYYTLASLQEEKNSPVFEMAERRGIVAVGPVEIADYLDRPQIVRRNGPAAISPMELDRWAGSLRDNVARVLVDNLAVLLAPSGMVVVPWEETAEQDGRVRISVNRIEATEEGMVLLEARWSLLGGVGELLETDHQVIVEQVRGSGVEAQVEAMSRTLAGLSRRIADAVMAASLKGG